MEKLQIGELQRPNCSLIVAYARMPLPVKAELMKFFFEEIKISKLCLLPKALAVCQLAEMRTGIVVDSGATSTYVWVVVDGRVDAARTQTQSVGGWHVAEFLKNALAWRGNKEADGATVSSLDTLSVKQKCRLSLNIAREDQRPSSGASKTETLHIKSQRDAARLSKLEPTEVTLSSELFLAPEMMYASLDLPAMVQEATRDLPDYLVKDCFSRILLTGEYPVLFAVESSSDLTLASSFQAATPTCRASPTGYPAISESSCQSTPTSSTSRSFPAATRAGPPSWAPTR